MVFMLSYTKFSFKVKMLSKLAQYIENNWYQSAWKNLWLLPFWLLAWVFVYSKRRRFLANPPPATAAPVIIVGNINVGGTGKTPLITCLVAMARELGFNPGVISRGYGGKAANYPLIVTGSTSVLESGDEPKLLHQRLACPIVVAPKRIEAAEKIAELGANLIFSDDGLQHYGLARQAEIIVTDEKRQFGNGWLLPIGPLREPISRLNTADLVLSNGKDFKVQASALVNALTGDRVPLSTLMGKKVDAVAGIGNPARFYDTLQGLGAEVNKHSFADHHQFAATDFEFSTPDTMLVMTEKDWVKCTAFAKPNWWYLQVDAVLSQAAEQAIKTLLASFLQKG